MYALDFFAALRVGEITTRPGQPTNNLIDTHQLCFFYQKNAHGAAMKLGFIYFKQSDPSKPVELVIYRESPVCPVALMLEYLNIRGSAPGPLLCWSDGSPITRSYFIQSVRQNISYCGLEKARYESHSFRIGATFWAAIKGLSDA